MIIPIYYQCACGGSDVIKLDEENIQLNTLICTDCKHCKKFMAGISVKYYDRIKKEIEYNFSLRLIEKENK